MKLAIRFLIPLFIIIVGAVLIGFYKWNQPQYIDFAVISPSGEKTVIKGPEFIESSGVGTYTMTGTIVMNAWGSRVFRIIPDDRIESLQVNGTRISLAKLSPHQRKDYDKGFQYDLSPYLHTGENQVVAKYFDRGGLMGLVLAVEVSGSYSAIIIFMGFILISILFFYWAKRIGVVPPVLFIFVIAIAIRVFYFSQTGVDERGHDMGDHFAYTKYLAEHWAPPPVDYAVGGAFFHPPLSYYLGAVVYKATKLIEPHNNMVAFRVQQFFCMTCAIGFLLYGLRILQEIFLKRSDVDSGLIRRRWYRWLLESNTRQALIFSAALFAFWPTGIIHSARIGNDPLLYSLFAAGLYYILLWYRNNSNKDLIIASALAAAATMTKANGEILIAVLGLLGLIRMIRTREWLFYLKRSIIPLLIVIPAIAITVGPALILKFEGKREKLYIDNLDGISTANLVGNTAANYLWFDAKIFVTEAFTDPYDDRYGRQYFWNYLGKTGLIGEFKYPYPVGVNCAIALSALSIFMFFYILAGLYLLPSGQALAIAPILLAGGLLWAGVTYMRMTFPANIDFRYIVPILITICSLYGMSIIQFERIGARRAVQIGKMLAGLFVATSIIFIATVD